MAQKLGTTQCPNCGPVAITDPNRFVIIYPRGLGNAQAQVTCEKCSMIYNIKMRFEHARKFDDRGCPVRGFSFARGEQIQEGEIEDFISHINERLNDFLDVVYEDI